MLPPRTSSISVHPSNGQHPIIDLVPSDNDRLLGTAEQRDSFRLLLFIEANSVYGAAKSLLTFCDTLNRLSVPASVSIATFHRGPVSGNNSPNDFVEAARKRGITTYVIPERRRFDHQLLTSIRAVIHRASPDLVQTNNVKSHFLIKVAGVAARCPWIAFHHGYTTTDLKMKCYNQLDHWSLPSATRVVTVCGAFERQLVALGVPGEKLRVVHNGGTLISRLPAIHLSHLKSRFDIHPQTRVLLTIGRLSQEKGHADLLAAANCLRQLRPALDFKMILVGSGPERAKLEAQTAKLGLRSRIVFACNEPDVVPFLNIADVFVLPSRTEGSPHVIFEAMGAGVPIVATRVGGIPEILQDGETALLAPPRRPELLAAAIARMSDSTVAAQGYASKAHEVLANRHSPEIFAQTLLGIYGESLRRRIPFTS